MFHVKFFFSDVETFPNLFIIEAMFQMTLIHKLKHFRVISFYLLKVNEENWWPG